MMLPPRLRSFGRLALIALLAVDIVLGLVFGLLVVQRPEVAGALAPAPDAPAAPATPTPLPARHVTGAVVDAYSGQPLAGVTLTLGGQQTTTDGQGAFTLPAVTAPALLLAQPPAGYAGVEYRVPAGDQQVKILLRPTTIAGTITTEAGAPLKGVTVRAVGPGGTPAAAATTDADGRYTLRDVPEGARLMVEGPTLSRREIAIGQRTAVDLKLRPDVIAGTVRAKDGQPVAGATVVAGAATATTGDDGAYTLGGIPPAGTLLVRARGYRPQQRPLEGAASFDFALEPLVVKAIYLTPHTIADERRFNELVALADRTEINAMVLDVKDETGRLYHDSTIEAARAIGAVRPTYDLAARLKTLKDHGIYAIARIVCFQDQTLATKRPDLAIRNPRTGGVWKNVQGVAWTSAMKPETWDYNAAIAAEAARLGFDEIQYDYVRFPTDGDRTAIDLGGPNTFEARTNAIAGFLKRTREVLAPYGVALAIDVFGIVLFDRTDFDQIGQSLEKMAPYVDYICPMVYPSHYIPGALGFDIPNNHPYEIVLGSLQKGADRVPTPHVTFRPWLQDFSYGRGIDYGPNEVRAQIKATYDFGATSWMLWNAANTFSEAALLPDNR
jgi:hypothetical protein